MGKIILVFLLSCLSYQCVGCSCGAPQKSFFEGGEGEQSYCIAVYDTTIFKQITNFEPPIINRNAQLGYFKVIDTINSINTQIGNTIVVFGQDGHNCLETLNHWERGDTVVLGLLNLTEMRDTFEMSVCTRNFLTIENGLAEGLNIPEIKQKIVDIILPTDYVFLNQQIELFPNPTNDEVHVRSEELEIRSIQIFDIIGRQVAKENWKKKSDRPIDLSILQRGIYNLLIETDQGRIMRKVVKL